MITIIDYGSGNLKSIKNGFSKIGADAIVSSSIKEINDRKPFLGVCLGLQVLFSSSEENQGVDGLGIFEGEVVHFPESVRKQGLKIPQMGWNQLNIKSECPILTGVGNEFMYFVHSYYVNPKDKKIIVATVNYGIDVPAVVCKDNIFATQFHPEKSGEIGLQILKNFVELVSV